MLNAVFVRPVSSLARPRPPPALACPRRPQPSSSAAIVVRRSRRDLPLSSTVAAALIVTNLSPRLSSLSLVAVSHRHHLSQSAAVLAISRMPHHIPIIFRRLLSPSSIIEPSLVGGRRSCKFSSTAQTSLPSILQSTRLLSLPPSLISGRAMSPPPAPLVRCCHRLLPAGWLLCCSISSQCPFALSGSMVSLTPERDGGATRCEPLLEVCWPLADQRHRR